METDRSPQTYSRIKPSKTESSSFRKPASRVNFVYYIWDILPVFGVASFFFIFAPEDRGISPGMQNLWYFAGMCVFFRFCFLTTRFFFKRINDDKNEIIIYAVFFIALYIITHL